MAGVSREGQGGQRNGFLLGPPPGHSVCASGLAPRECSFRSPRVKKLTWGPTLVPNPQQTSVPFRCSIITPRVTRDKK